MRSSPIFSSVSEKKDDYQERFNEFSESINEIKKQLKVFQALTPDNRLASLIERYEKCYSNYATLFGIILNTDG